MLFSFVGLLVVKISSFVGLLVVKISAFPVGIVIMIVLYLLFFSSLEILKFDTVVIICLILILLAIPVGDALWDCRRSFFFFFFFFFSFPPRFCPAHISGTVTR